MITRPLIKLPSFAGLLIFSICKSSASKYRCMPPRLHLSLRSSPPLLHYFLSSSMDGNQMLCSWYFTHAYNLPSHKLLLHNRFYPRLFPPLLVCYNHSTCETLWYRFNCSRGKLGDSSSCFTPMEGENIELDSLKSLALDSRT